MDRKNLEFIMDRAARGEGDLHALLFMLVAELYDRPPCCRNCGKSEGTLPSLRLLPPKRDDDRVDVPAYVMAS